MRKLMIAAAAALCAASVPAAASEGGNSSAGAQAQQNAQPAARDANDDQRRICVNERPSESRITRRVCRTAREWRDANDTDFER